jgi:hypothetical protein
MRHSIAPKLHSAEKFHPKPHGLKKQSNKKSFICANTNIWPKNRFLKILFKTGQILIICYAAERIIIKLHVEYLLAFETKFENISGLESVS